MAEELKQNRTDLTNFYLNHQRELIRQQRKYKKIITTKYLNRKEYIRQASHLRSIEHLKTERKDLRAQIWVACGTTHLRQNENRLKNIKCHVACQEQLAADNKKLKSQIQVLELQLKRVNKNIYDLNRKTIPDNQHQAHVSRVRRTMEILENQLDVGIKRECNFTAANRRLREDIVRMLNFRAFFNDLYTKMIQRLKSDKKYLIDLIEYAQLTFENGIAIYEKILAINKKEAHDRELRKVEMQGITRKTAQDNENFEFILAKDQHRGLADLEPREYKRRELFRQNHRKQMKLYETVLDKILAHSNTQSIEQVIGNFQEQETLYHSYFTHSNEKSYRLAIMHSALNDLCDHIENLRMKDNHRMEQQIETIVDLKQKLEAQLKVTQKYLTKRDNCEKALNGYIKDIHEICILCRADASPFEDLIGGYSSVPNWKVKEFLRILEERLNQIVAEVFIEQRKDPKIKTNRYVVRNLQKICEPPTDLNDIVLTQQCPECAEGEAVNTDAADCVIQSLKDTRKKLHEKVVQPEMQYRLHSLNECRLQRSRMLVNTKL